MFFFNLISPINQTLGTVTPKHILKNLMTKNMMIQITAISFYSQG